MFSDTLFCPENAKKTAEYEKVTNRLDGIDTRYLSDIIWCWMWVLCFSFYIELYCLCTAITDVILVQIWNVTKCPKQSYQCRSCLSKMHLRAISVQQLTQKIAGYFRQSTN